MRSLLKSGGYSARLSRIIVLLFTAFTIQYTDNKAKFYCGQAGDDLHFAIFLTDTRNYAYRSTTDDEYSVHHDHI